MQRWTRSSLWGVKLGVICALVYVQFFIDPAYVIYVAILVNFAFLGVMDLAWRWLPVEWTIALWGLALAIAIENQQVSAALLAGCCAAGCLWVISVFFRYWKSAEVMGLGDIWLSGAVGTLFGVVATANILAIAALTALISEVLRQNLRGPNHRYGVPFGAHIALVASIWLIYFF